MIRLTYVDDVTQKSLHVDEIEVSFDTTQLDKVMRGERLGNVIWMNGSEYLIMEKNMRIEVSLEEKHKYKKFDYHIAYKLLKKELMKDWKALEDDDRKLDL